jgi:hypothetical protein
MAFAGLCCRKEKTNDLDSLDVLAGHRLCLGGNFGIHELMKTLRLLLWFVVGFMLSTAAVLAHADSYPVVTQYSAVGVTGTYSTQQSACDAFGAQQLGGIASTYNATLNRCMYTIGAQTYQGSAVGPVQSCPYGGTNSNGVTCDNAPACVAPQVRDAVTGECKAPAEECPMYSGANNDPYPNDATKPSNCSCPSGSEWFPFNGCRKRCDMPISGVANAGWGIAIPAGQAMGCFGGCEVQHAAGPYDILKDGSHSATAYWGKWACAGNGPGTAPTANGQPQPDNQAIKDSDKKPPKCGAGEGVITSSSGNVLCLPAGTPNTSTPKVETQKKTETYPDNSTKTTEITKTTDPNTGATHISNSTTSSGGQAGPAGTTTGSESSSGVDGNGDGDGDGDCDPTLQMCGKPSTEGLYEKKDKTFGSVLNKFSDDIKATPFGQAVETTLNISVPSSGSCPNLSAEIPYLNTRIDLAPYICNPTAIEYLEMMGTVLKIVVGYIALTWVFL